MPLPAEFGASILVSVPSLPRRNSSSFQNAMVRSTKSRSKPGVRSRNAPTARSSGLPSYTVVAADIGVPRVHILAMRA